ncbi:MAG: hypothetical protein GF334_01530 [Candidatus Altiarchaeales archaeon]|nr:hypothetical protein [Candidatus Altiarchaeales archaeon]
MSKKTEINEKDLDNKAEKDPKSKRWNNANSRKNLKQYQKDKKEEPVVPEVVSEDEEDNTQAQALVVGRKISPDLVKKLMPQRGVLTAAEKKRFNGIVITYLADFKNEEPTAADVDDIFEIAKSDIMETRLLQASKSDPQALVSISQAIEKLNKRKQQAKENLSSRRVDRKGTRASADVNIIDLVVQFDSLRKNEQRDKIDALMAEEDETSQKLRKVLEDDGY